MKGKKNHITFFKFPLSECRKMHSGNTNLKKFLGGGPPNPPSGRGIPLPHPPRRAFGARRVAPRCIESITSRQPNYINSWLKPWSGANHRSTCLRHSPTDDSSSSYRRIRTPGGSGQMPCPCPGTRRGAFCTPFRHSRWSLKYCRRSLSHQEWRWFWSLNCNRQHHGSQSWWTYPKKIRSRCSSKVKTCWRKTFGWETGWPRLVTSDRQIYMRGNSPGHPESEGSFQGSCQHDVKVPTGIFTTSVWISLVKICGVLSDEKMACVSSQKSSFQHLHDAPLQGQTTTLDDNITSHVCGFCATSLGVRSGSRPAHQATGQGFPVGTSGATQNHA